MTGEGYREGSSGSGLMYEPVVESILDAELYGREALPTHTTDTYSQVDIRRFAHDVVMGKVAQARGTSFTNSDAVQADLRDMPDQAELTHIRTLLDPHRKDLVDKVDRAHYLYHALPSLIRETSDVPGLQARADFQYRIIKAVWGQMQKVRIHHNEELDIGQTLQNGIVVVAPPGAGKTYMATSVLKMCSVGNKIFPDDVRQQTALVAVPSLRLIRQYLSDNPRNMFRSLLGWDTPIGEYHGGAKNLLPVTLITQASLRLATEQGKIARGDYDYLVFDEVHHLSAQENFRAMRSISNSVIGMTASPYYNARRDLRRWFPHEGGGTYSEFVQAGILNDIELSTYDAEDRQEAAIAAAKLTAEWIDEGLRVATYCSPGGYCAQARKIAEMTNQLLGREGIRAIGHFEGNTTDADTAAFAEGKLRGLALTGMLKEGWDEEVDGVIIVGPRQSLTEVVQMAGRVSRLAAQRSRLAEVIARDVTRAQGVSIWSALGFTQSRENLSWSDADSPPEGKNLGTRKLHVPEGLTSSPLPRPSRRLLLARHSRPEDVPEGYVRDTSLAEHFNTSPVRIQSALKDGRIPVVIQSHFDGQDIQNLQWYAPEAYQYLQEHPPLQLADPNAMGLAELSIATNLSAHIISRIAEDSGAYQRRVVCPETGKTRSVFDGPTASKILASIEAMPFAEPDDVLLADMSRLMGRSFLDECLEKMRIAPCEKRMNPVGSIRGLRPYLTASEAQRVRQEYERLQGGAPDEIVIPKGLNSYIVPQAAALRRFSLSQDELNAFLDKVTAECHEAVVNEQRLPCMTWTALEAIEYQHEATDRLASINYRRLPDRENGEPDVANVAYARIIQAHYGQISAEDSMDLSLACNALNITKYGIRHLLRSSEVITHQHEYSVTLSGLVRVLPDIDAEVKVSSQHIRASALVSQHNMLNWPSRADLQAEVNRIALMGIVARRFGRAQPDEVAELYFHRARVLSYLKGRLAGRR